MANQSDSQCRTHKKVFKIKLLTVIKIKIQTFIIRVFQAIDFNAETIPDDPLNTLDNGRSQSLVPTDDIGEFVIRVARPIFICLVAGIDNGMFIIGLDDPECTCQQHKRNHSENILAQIYFKHSKYKTQSLISQIGTGHPQHLETSDMYSLPVIYGEMGILAFPAYNSFTSRLFLM